MDRLSRWWKNDPVANAAVASFESDPKHFSKMLGAQLKHQLTKDEALAKDLRSLVDNIGPRVEVIQKIEVARGVMKSSGTNFEQAQRIKNPSSLFLLRQI